MSDEKQYVDLKTLEEFVDYLDYLYQKRNIEESYESYLEHFLYQWFFFREQSVVLVEMKNHYDIKFYPKYGPDGNVIPGIIHSVHNFIKRDLAKGFLSIAERIEIMFNYSKKDLVIYNFEQKNLVDIYAIFNPDDIRFHNSILTIKKP